MNLKELLKWQELSMTIGPEMTENVLFKKMNIEPNTQISPIVLIKKVNEYIENHPNEMLTDNIALLDMVKVFSWINVGIDFLSRIKIYQNNLEDLNMTEEDLKSLEESCNIELDYDKTKEVFKYLEDYMKRIQDILGKIKDKIEISEEDIKFFEEEIKFQSVRMPDHPFFVKPESGELTFEIFKERYLQQLAPTMQVHEKGTLIQDDEIDELLEEVDHTVNEMCSDEEQYEGNTDENMEKTER